MKYYQKNLLVLSLTNFLAASSWNQVIPFMPQFLRELGVGAQIAAWSGFVYAIQYVSGIIMQPIWGKISDRYGRKPMVIRAGFCLAFVYFGMSLCQAPWQLAMMRFLNGALTGFVPGAIALIATNTPGALAGRFVAVAQTANAAGNIAGPAIGGLLAAGFGYRSAMRLSGFSVVISTLLVIFLVEERQKVTASAPTSLWEDVCLTAKQPVLLVSLGLVFLGTMLSVSVQPLLTLYLEKLSPSGPPWLAGMIFSLPGLAFVLSAYPWNRLGERFTYARVALWGLWGACGFLLLSSFMGTIGKFSLFYLVYGVFLAAITPSAASIIARSVHEEFRGRAYGMQQAVTNMGGLIAPLLAGAAANRWGLAAAFWSSSAVVFVLASLLWFGNRSVSSRDGTAKVHSSV
jgi:DHA1 family multidrug resistance protein-like MFS transporter